MEPIKTEQAAPQPSIHRGSCHCGAVRFEAEIDVSAGAGRCNCTVCTKVATTGSVVKPSAFRLLAGAEHLSSYAWGPKISRRFFCKECGVHCYGAGFLEQVGGDYVSVNWNCLDDVDVGNVKLGYWDGRHNNWQGGMRPTPWPIEGQSSFRAS
jgi:hypothetical protein